MIGALLSAIVGVWLTAAPGVLGYGGVARVSDHIAGPLAFLFGVTAIWEHMRPARWANLPIGFWVTAAALFSNDGKGLVSGLAAGFLLIGLSFWKGRYRP